MPLEDILKCLDNETKPIKSSFIIYPARCSLQNLISFTFFKVIPALFCVFLLHFPLLQLFTGSTCVLSPPLMLTEIMHPLVNCSMCQGVTEAPRFVNLTRKEFALHHAHSSRPIVVVGAALDWPAMQVFSYDYFRGLYYSFPESLDADTSKGQFFSYSSNIHDLKELFELTSERAAMITERWYIGW